MKKLKLLIFFTVIVTGQVSFAQERHTKKLIVITFDGYRWQELFRGADSALLFNRKYVSQDSLSRVKKFWGKDISERRSKLMPFFWNEIALRGRIYGNRDLGNLVNVRNPYWFSYPGYNEIFTGYPDTLINSNSFPPNPNENVWEFINKKPGFQGKVAIFASWDAFYRILNEKRSGLYINAGYSDLKDAKLTDVQKTLSAQQHFLPKIFGDSERPDAVTYSMAMEYLKQNHPKILQLSFIDTDAYAHQGKYDFYLDAAHYNDSMISNVWKFIQSDPFYKDQTTLMIAVDHGRGDVDKWRNHNNSTPGSNNIWFAMMGPDTKPEGEIKTPGQVYQNQYAKTIATLLGFDFVTAHPAGDPIESVFK